MKIIYIIKGQGGGSLSTTFVKNAGSATDGGEPEIETACEKSCTQSSCFPINVRYWINIIIMNI